MNKFKKKLLCKRKLCWNKTLFGVFWCESYTAVLLGYLGCNILLEHYFIHCNIYCMSNMCRQYESQQVCVCPGCFVPKKINVLVPLMDFVPKTSWS